MGQMWEQVLAKLQALTAGVGRMTMGVAFTPLERLEGALAALHGAGFPRMGREQLYSGATGEPLDGRSYVGCVFYQRLRHMVASPGFFFVVVFFFSVTSQGRCYLMVFLKGKVKEAGLPDKVHARSLGPVNQLVRQPTEGRARQGGLRIGEMERDCLLAHGTSALMQERLLHKSDGFRMVLCRRCGRATCHDGRHCAACAQDTAVGVLVPYSFKLLLQEISAMGIDWQIGGLLDPKPEQRKRFHH